jgi:hypothetical protein
MPRIVAAAVSNRLNPSIGSDSLLYPAMILLDHVVQILAGSHLYSVGDWRLNFLVSRYFRLEPVWLML